MTFEEWYNEIEGYGTRADRFDEWMFSTGDADRGKDWLLAAYNAGFKEGSKQPIPLTITTPPHIKYPTAANPKPDDPFKRTHEATWPNIKSCSKCGINLSGIMGYVCYDMKCPTQMRISAGGGSGAIGANGPAGPVFGSDRYSDMCGYTNCSSGENK
jgi:hypothetical protein